MVSSEPIKPKDLRGPEWSKIILLLIKGSWAGIEPQGICTFRKQAGKKLAKPTGEEGNQDGAVKEAKRRECFKKGAEDRGGSWWSTGPVGRHGLPYWEAVRSSQ